MSELEKAKASSEPSTTDGIILKLGTSQAASNFRLLTESQGFYPMPSSYLAGTSAGIAFDVRPLSDELTRLREQIVALQEEMITDQTIAPKVMAILETTDRAVGQSESLTARLVLPPTDLTDVHLVPAHSLERLEEYRSDENLAYLLVGAFVGALLGIPVNWVTNERITINGPAILLAIVFAFIASTCGLWLARLRNRAARVKSRMLQTTLASASSREQPEEGEPRDS